MCSVPNFEGCLLEQGTSLEAEMSVHLSLIFSFLSVRTYTCPEIVDFKATYQKILYTDKGMPQEQKILSWVSIQALL